jgi:uncharacterized protein YbcI
MVPHEQDAEGPGRQDGALEAAISTAMVQMLHHETGRGPTRARTTIGEDLVVCVMSATLTKGEQNLADNDHGALVLRGRQAHQEIMKVKAITSVEGLTGRTVTAFMSCNHLDPDLAAEVFVLRPLAGRAE